MPRLGIAECPHKRRREHRLFGESRASIRFRQRHTKALTPLPQTAKGLSPANPGTVPLLFSIQADKSFIQPSAYATRP